jgi:hypothetical protein
MAEDQRALPQVAQHQRGQDEEGPGQADGPDPEVAHVRVQGLAARHGQDDRTEDEQAVDSMTEEERRSMVRREGTEDLRLLDQVIHPQHRHRPEPDCHDRPEELAHMPGPQPLDREQRDQDGAGERTHQR